MDRPDGPAQPNFIWAKWNWAKKAQVHFGPTFLGQTRPKIWSNGLAHFFTALHVVTIRHNNEIAFT